LYKLRTSKFRRFK